MIEVGYGDVTHIDKRHPKTILDLSGTLVFEGPCHIGHGSSLRVEGKLVLGSYFRITARSTVIATEFIKFGNHCLLSWDMLVMDTDFHEISENKNQPTNLAKPISVGNHVWFGCRSTILKGSRIPDNCVIGSNSLVSSQFDIPNIVLAGVPARIIKKDINWQ